MILYHFLTVFACVLLTLYVHTVNGFGVEVRSLIITFEGNTHLWDLTHSWPRRRIYFASAFEFGVFWRLSDNKDYATDTLHCPSISNTPINVNCFRSWRGSFSNMLSSCFSLSPSKGCRLHLFLRDRTRLITSHTTAKTATRTKDT